MGEIDDAHDPEDQGDPNGHQEQHHTELHAVEELLDEELNGHAARRSLIEREARGAECTRLLWAHHAVDFDGSSFGFPPERL
jgi:hypothetical protein